MCSAACIQNDHFQRSRVDIETELRGANDRRIYHPHYSKKNQFVLIRFS